MSKWDSVKKVIATVAPGLATGLGGPLAGAAVAFITKALGLKPEDEDAAIAALASSPDALLKLKLAEIEYQKFRDELGIKDKQLDVEDRASARALATVRGLLPQVSLSAVYTFGYFALLFGMMTGYFTVPDDGRDLLVGVIGTLTGGQVAVMNFWLGSSSGSQKKTEALAAK